LAFCHDTRSCLALRVGLTPSLRRAFALGAFDTWALRAPPHHSQARMTHTLPVPTPPRHSPACRSLSESTFALEPWDHRLPSSRFALLQRQPSPARSGASRASPGRGTRRACPARPQRCLLHPWGTGLATQCRWLAPPPDVSAPLTPWVSLGRPETSCAPLPVEYSTECRSGDASIQKTTLPRALGCQLLSSDPTDVLVPPDVSQLFYRCFTDVCSTDVPPLHLLDPCSLSASLSSVASSLSVYCCAGPCLQQSHVDHV